MTHDLQYATIAVTYEIRESWQPTQPSSEPPVYRPEDRTLTGQNTTRGGHRRAGLRSSDGLTRTGRRLRPIVGPCRGRGNDHPVPHPGGPGGPRRHPTQ